MNSTTDQWYAGLNDSASAVAHIVKTVGTPPAAATVSEPFTPTIRLLTTPPDAQQPGTAALLATGDNRVQTVGWQSNALAFAVAIDPANTSNGWVAGEIGGHNNFGPNGWATAIGQVLVVP